jgi:hypothetical protein
MNFDWQLLFRLGMKRLEDLDGLAFSSRPGNLRASLLVPVIDDHAGFAKLVHPFENRISHVLSRLYLSSQSVAKTPKKKQVSMLGPNPNQLPNVL